MRISINVLHLPRLPLPQLLDAVHAMCCCIDMAGRGMDWSLKESKGNLGFHLKVSSGCYHTL